MQTNKGSNARILQRETEGYLVALIGVVVCTLARYPLQGVLDTRAPYAFYLPFVAFCAWRYGMRPAAACFGMGATLGTYLYVRPIYAITNKPEAISLLIFLGTSVAVAMIGETNRRSHEQLETTREELRKANRELEARVEERTAALVEKNEDLSSFTYTVAHDLRSAIRSLVVNARILMDDEGDKLGPEGCDQARRLYSSAMRLSSFVDDLLQYARTGSKQVTRQVVNLTSVFTHQASVVQSEDANTSFDFRADGDYEVYGDQTLISLFTHNLVENAVKYRAPGRRLLIEFGSTIEDGKKCFYLRDNGMGFEPDFSERIFRPFERLHRYADIPGTGIGLSNVRRIIERHGGHVWATSDGPGKGATFYFTLERAAERADESRHELATAA